MRILRQALYEVFFSAWPVGVRGKTRWLSLLTNVLRIGPYGFLKFKSVGRYRLRLDPGDRNDRYYYFGMVGYSYTRLASLLLREGDIVIDVGGNVGNFSAVCAAIVGDKGKVYAIEANPALCDRLRTMAEEVPGGPIVVNHAAVWSGCGPMEFHVATETGLSSLHENATFNTLRTVTVEAMTLDDFVKQEGLSSVRLLKLDIEGAETDALLGARNSLGNGVFEWILLEAEPQRLQAFGRTGDEISSLMERHGYTPAAVIKEDRLIPMEDSLRVPGTFNGDHLYGRSDRVAGFFSELFQGDRK